MSANVNPWFSPERVSGLIPPPVTSGSASLLPPPDPPDPLSPLSPSFDSLFPTLAGGSVAKKQTSSLVETASSAAAHPIPSTSSPPTTGPEAGSASSQTGSEVEATSTVHMNSEAENFQGFAILPPKKSLPIHTDFHPANQKQKPQSFPSQQKSARKTTIPLLPRSNLNPSVPITTSNNTPSTTPEPTHSATSPPSKTWAQKVSHVANKSLSRLAPKEYSEAGIPQVTVPDDVFRRGAEMHKEFIVGSFLAKMPSYQAIQSVLNFLWGKGQKLDIRTNLKERTILVRIPNEFIRKKVLEKRLWYVGTAMFQVSTWTSDQEAAPIDLSAIPLWAHLTGLPLDLRSLEGLSFAAGLIGEPKETDEFTRNLTDVNLAHVKVDADLTTPLPDMIELKRTSGEIFSVLVDYPWIPPTCSFCNQLGHIQKDCLTAPEDKTPPETQSKTQPQNESFTPPSNPIPSPIIPPLNPLPVIPPDQDPTTPEASDPDFESDLMEILSPVQTTPSAPLDPPITPPLAQTPLSPLPLAPPLPLSPLQPSNLDEPQPIIFSSSPTDAPFVVALSAQEPRRASPFKHKVTRNKTLASQSRYFTTTNPFAILDPTLVNVSSSSSNSPKPPSPLNPFSHPFPPSPPSPPPPPPPVPILSDATLSLPPSDHDGSPLPQEENSAIPQ